MGTCPAFHRAAPQRANSIERSERTPAARRPGDRRAQSPGYCLNAAMCVSPMAALSGATIKDSGVEFRDETSLTY